MAGTFFPCCMEDACHDEVVTNTTNPDEDHQDKGACSPFFTCGTCSGAITNYLTILLPDIQPQQHINHEALYLLQLSAYSSTLFQPPRRARSLSDYTIFSSLR